MPQSTPQRHVAIRSFTFALCTLVATACAGNTRIGTILDDPTEYDGRQVRIEGEVTQTVGVPVVGGTYESLSVLQERDRDVR